MTVWNADGKGREPGRRRRRRRGEKEREEATAHTAQVGQKVEE